MESSDSINAVIKAKEQLLRLGETVEMDLAIVGFIIAVVGIVLQISDAFPDHREIRKTVVFVSIGVFLGILASAVAGAEYHITGNIDRRYAILFAILTCAVASVILAMVFKDDGRQTVASACAAGFMLIFFFGGAAVAVGESERRYEYTIDEVSLLADRAEKMGDYTTALDRLNELNGRVRSYGGNERIRKRVERIQALQEAKIGGGQ